MKRQVVIVGGGFGGLRAARALKSAPVEVTLIDRRNYHLFQPLLYQVATGSLSPGDIAAPLRSVLSRQKNTRVLLGEVVDVNPASRRVMLADGAELAYDELVIAAGSQSSARLRYWCARRPAAAAAARRGLALYQLDRACFAAGRRGREVRRVDGNPHYPSYDPITNPSLRATN